MTKDPVDLLMSPDVEDDSPDGVDSSEGSEERIVIGSPVGTLGGHLGGTGISPGGIGVLPFGVVDISDVERGERGYDTAVDADEPAENDNTRRD